MIAYPLEAVGTDFAALMTVTVGGVFAARGAQRRPGDGFRPSRRLCRASRTAVRHRRQPPADGRGGGPIIASIIKPSIGLSPHETAEVVRTLCEAGVDFIKDDEKLMSPAYSPLAERVSAIMPVIDAHEQRTGKRVMYAFGISSADPDRMMRNHDLVAEAGGTVAVVNINSIGMGGMSFLRKRSRLCLNAHRKGWDILTRHPGLGRSFAPPRRSGVCWGVEQFQINGIRAKYWEPDDSFVRAFHDCRTSICSSADRPLPVVGSGQWGGQAVDTYERTGRTLDLMYLGGGGIHGHPMGPAAGVMAIPQAWGAAEAGQTLEDAARERPELAAALEKFGE